MTPAAPDLGREAFDRVTKLAGAKGAGDAERVVRVALRRHPRDSHLHYLLATLLVVLGHDDEAEQEAEAALDLDGTLAVAHFLLGTLLRKRGDQAAALRAFRSARDHCAALDPGDEVAAGAGVRVGGLRSAVTAELDRLGEAPLTAAGRRA